MKKLLILLILMTALFTGCNTEKTDKKQSAQSDKRVTDAIEVLAEEWEKIYQQQKTEDTYLKIVNTNIVNIKDDATDIFADIDYIVEFSLLSNYYRAAPYYTNVGMKDSVVVYKNGDTKVSNNVFHLYQAKTYQTDFSEHIASIEEFDEAYNQIVKIK